MKGNPQVKSITIIIAALARRSEIIGVIVVAALLVLLDFLFGPKW